MKISLMARASRLVPRTLVVLAVATGCGLASIYSIAAAEVPMQGSEVRPLPGCGALENPAFMNLSHQSLIAELGWESWLGDVAPSFECYWSRHDEARCEALGWISDPGPVPSRACFENTRIVHGSGPRFQTRSEVEQALVHSDPNRVTIHDPRLEQPEYGNVLIVKNLDNSPIWWDFVMYVVTPDEWWQPIGSVVQVTRSFTLPAQSPNVIEAFKQASPPPPDDAAVVTAFLEMLEPAQCILPTPECIEIESERALQVLEGMDDQLRELKQQAEQSQRAMEEALRLIESQQPEEGVREMQERLREIKEQMMRNPNE